MPAPLSPGTDPILAIFDHDGILVDSLEWHKLAWLELGRTQGLHITPEFVHETFGMTNPMIFRKLLGDGISLEDARRFGDLKEACYRDLARGKISLMEGVEELLAGLDRANVRLAVGSSAPLPNVELTVADCGLKGRFNAIVALEDIVRGKPDPQVFLLAAERCGVDPSRAVVFEDAPVGIRAAKAAGMRAVGVTTSHLRETLLTAGADQVVDSLLGFDVAHLVKLLTGNSPGGEN